MTTKLFSPIRFRELNIKNRIFVSPMCQYSAVDGVPNSWHLVHLGSRAVGGAGLVMVEATGVNPKGRISPGDLGIWNDIQTEAFKPITKFILEQNSVPAIQLAHAGRKASTHVPWQGTGRVELNAGGWTPDAPSAIAFSDHYVMPHALETSEIDGIVNDFVAATKRSLEAGFQVIEIHMAHGYLLHEFLSPLSNQRKDEYGGSLENRMRLPLKVAAAMRAAWPAKWPVFVRISATDWAPSGGWDLEQSIVFAKELKKLGIDLIDCSTGGTLARADIPTGPGYQVRFASEIRKQVDIATGAVGEITTGQQAESILQNEQADVILLARELLRDPYFALHAAKELGADIEWPKQYTRAKP
jgi:2,4-dienoyl-CoA reductase-like NADH-dependent reductase (Old Yellow Enzyme family)